MPISLKRVVNYFESPKGPTDFSLSFPSTPFSAQASHSFSPCIPEQEFKLPKSLSEKGGYLESEEKSKVELQTREFDLGQ